MSAEFYFILESTLFRVKADHDGTLTFIDPPVDMEYEIAFTAMGGEKSPALKLYETWDKDPITLITHHIPTENLVSKEYALTLKNLYLLSLDWAEHTLHFYTNKNQSRHRRVTAMLRDTRAAWRQVQSLPKGRVAWHISGEISTATLHAISSYSVIASDNAERYELSAEMSPEVSLELWGVWNSVAALSAAMHKEPRKCADRAVTAFARHSGAAEASDEFYTAYRKEQNWQIRRFVDVMTALQAGKDWPPLGATP